jgi:hypothetical protein
MKIPSAIRCVSNHHPPPRRSNRLAGLSSDNVCLSNYKSGEKEIWNAAHEKDSSSSEFGKVPHQDIILEHKTLETPQPDEPHSANFSNPHPVSSPELGDGFEASFNPYRHGTRDPDSKDDYERKKNVRLNLPDSHDKKSWNELDLILSDVLPRMFNSAKIRSTPSSQLATEFDDFLYGFFLDLCGTVESPIAKQKANSGFKHKGLESLRRRKRDCKKAIKDLRKKGHAEDSQPILALKSVWKNLLRAHNKLRRAVKYKARTRAKKFAKRQFNKDRIKFAKNLFSGQRKSGTPSFSQEVGESYFRNLYRDDDRSADFSPLENMTRPPLPEHAFDVRPPTFKEFRSSILGKRNGAAPGLNALTYIIFKKCSSVLKTLYKICLHVYKSKDIPEDWAAAFVVLLQKSDSLDNPEEFRPIAITNTAGKIFFSIIAVRLQKFMIKNKYIKTSLQKGFLFGIPGCIEHSFAFVEALRQVKSEKRAIVLSWIDLANAYGSVKHNLIQFALNWYHVPELIQGLIFDYYEKLRASITTSDWITDFLTFDIGLFQGCVLSTILFDCVFNLLLDFLEPLESKYAVKVDDKVVSFLKAYADDLQFSTNSPEGHQIVLDKTDQWLGWTKTMRAKPKKCVCMAFRQFRKSAPPSKYVKVDNSIYSVYDPQISIAGKRMKFILQDDSFKGSHFKFLGRWLNPKLSESAIKQQFLFKFNELMGIVDNAPLDGFMKLWIYQHFLLGMLSWPLLIQDFNRDFVDTQVSRPCGVFLRRWAGVFKSIDAGCLYRSKDRFGLGLTQITTFFEKLQVIKFHLLKHSEDPQVSALYELRRDREKSHLKIWRPTQLLEKVVSMSNFDLKYQHALPGDRRGLGHGVFTQASVSPSNHRELCTQNVQRLADEKLEAHSHGLSMQGVWLQWEQGVFPFDLSWDNLILGPGGRIVSFVLNATHNSVMTPDLRHICGLVDDASCKICGSGRKATLHHILAGCSHALSDFRYTWRHDSVLFTLFQFIEPALLKQNANPPSSAAIPVISKSFVPAGTTVSSRNRVRSSCSLLGKSTDWKLLLDFRHNPYLFPPHIYPTNERPDILIYSNSARIVIFGELTCPAEEGISEAKLRKESRYADLANKLRNSQNPWLVHILTLEVGARGFVGRSTYKFLRKIGLSCHAAKISCRQVSEVAARCSYAIYLRHTERDWNSSRRLLVPNSCKEPISEIHPSLRDKIHASAWRKNATN